MMRILSFFDGCYYIDQHDFMHKSIEACPTTSQLVKVVTFDTIPILLIF